MAAPSMHHTVTGRNRRPRGRWLRLLMLLLIPTLSFAYVFSVPLYAGSSVGPVTWRLEHGRLSVYRRLSGSQDSFYIAYNSEGLLFAPSLSVNGLNDWTVTIPIWALLLLCTAVFFASAIRDRRRARRSIGTCANCGYDIRGVSRCPECGTTVAMASQTVKQSRFDPARLESRRTSPVDADRR